MQKKTMPDVRSMNLDELTRIPIHGNGEDFSVGMLSDSDLKYVQIAVASQWDDMPAHLNAKNIGDIEQFMLTVLAERASVNKVDILRRAIRSEFRRINDDGLKKSVTRSEKLLNRIADTERYRDKAKKREAAHLSQQREAARQAQQHEAEQMARAELMKDELLGSIVAAVTDKISGTGGETNE